MYHINIKELDSIVNYTINMHKIISYLLKHIKHIFIIVFLVVLCLLSFWAWYYIQKQQESIANREMFQAVYQFEAGNYDKALHGEEHYAGFVEITNKYRLTKTKNLAYLYAGICLMQQANYAQAIEYLTHFKTNQVILQARAWSLIGDAYIEQALYNKAIKYYLKAAKHDPNEEYTPTYWIKLAGIYELKEEYENALRCHKNVIHYYPKSRLYAESKKQINRLEEKQKINNRDK